MSELVWRDVPGLPLAVNAMGAVRRPDGQPKATWLSAAGYPMVTVDHGKRQRKHYLLHRLIWLAFNGQIPAGKFVDHRDRDRANCRLGNLRLVDRSMNQRNRSKRKDGVHSRYLGVTRRHCRYVGRVRFDGRNLYTASFTDPLDAAVARDDLAVSIAGHSLLALNIPERYAQALPSAARPRSIKPVYGYRRLLAGETCVPMDQFLTPHGKWWRWEGTQLGQQYTADELPSRRPVALRHFVLVDGRLHATLQRLDISEQAAVADHLDIVLHAEDIWLDVRTAIDWAGANVHAIPDHLQVCRLLLRYAAKA